MTLISTLSTGNFVQAWSVPLLGIVEFVNKPTDIISNMIEIFYFRRSAGYSQLC